MHRNDGQNMCMVTMGLPIPRCLPWDWAEGALAALSWRCTRPIRIYAKE